MHVGVDLARIERDEKRQHGMTIARQVVGIGRTYGAENELVAHRAAIDEEILPERVGLRERRRCGIAGDHDALALGMDLDGVAAEFGPQNIAEPGQPSGGTGQGGGPGHRRALLAREREGDVGPRHGEAPDDLADGFRLGAVGLQKLQARRRRIEEVANLDAGAVGQRRRHDLGFLAALDAQRPGVRLARMPRRDRQPCNRADRGQCLPAKPERANLQQVLVIELGGGVALDREREVLRGHAAAVVGNADPPPPTAVGEDVDPACAGINGVLDEFLDHARRPLDHLAGGDAVDDLFWQLTDGHEFDRARSWIR